MSSFSESDAANLINDSLCDFIRHTKRQLVRVYPSASRACSSNYSPFPFWSAGAQIVALNFQTNSKEMRFYRGFFQSNGNCGYVLKPSSLIGNENYQECLMEKRLKISVISAQRLPKTSVDSASIVDPYVTIKIQSDVDTLEGRTRVVANNGLNPLWNETFEFVIKSPEMAVVCFTVKDKQSVGRSHFVGSYALPVRCIKPGNLSPSSQLT